MRELRNNKVLINTYYPEGTSRNTEHRVIQKIEREEFLKRLEIVRKDFLRRAFPEGSRARKLELI